MGTNFQIEAVLEMPSRGQIFAFGILAAGKVRIGQKVVLPAGIPSVATVEAVNSKSPANGNIALGFRYETPRQLAGYKRLLEEAAYPTEQLQPVWLITSS